MTGDTQTARGCFWYLRWPAQPLWGSLSLLLFHSQWPRDAPEALGTAGCSSKQMPWRKGRGPSAPRQSETERFQSGLGCCWLRHPPAHQAEPGETVVEGVAPSQGVVTVLHSAAGELGCTVVHLSHQVQPLPVGGRVLVRLTAYFKH